MVRRLFFVLYWLLFTNILCGADPRTFTRQESKDVAKRASKIVLNEESPILERVIERSLSKNPDYKSTVQLEEREQVIEKLSKVEQEGRIEEDLKSELMQWAIKELAERNSYEVSQRQGEQRKKWIAATIGLISTLITIVVPIVFSEDCDCPSDG